MMKTKFYSFAAFMTLVVAFIMQSVGVTAQTQTITIQHSSAKQGFNVKESKSDAVEIQYVINEFYLEDFTANGEQMKSVLLPGVFLPNDEGAPNLAGESRFIAIPQGATPVLDIKSVEIEKFQNIEVGPAPRIPLESDDSPLHYEKNQAIYSVNAFYPEQPIKLSEVSKIRGVDVVILGITPFQYNPITKELIVYKNIDVEVRFEGGNAQFGDNAYRNPYFDAILSDNLLNYSSLPHIDYNERYASYYAPTENDECEYIIICPDGPEFQAWADSIRQFRTEQGILTKVFTLTQVGGNTTTAIETFINNAYNNWSIKPIACLLLADYGTNATNSIISPIYDNYCVSDNIYADVDGDMMPDVVFSRITARNETELQVMVTKALNYERNPPTDTTFYNRPITALGWQTVRWFQICSEVVGGFFRNTLGKSPIRQNAIYAGNPNVDPWSTATNTSAVLNYFGPNGQGYIPATPQELGGWTGGTATGINNAINNGAFILQHRDHGMETGWGEPSYTNSNINALYNTDLTFVMTINCLTGKYNWGSECFAEKFHRHTKNGLNAGALGLLAPSETSYSFVNDTYVWGVYDNWWTDFMPSYASTPEPRGILPSFGNAAGKYFLRQSSWPYNTNNKAVTYYLFHHHGEAWNVIYTEMPQPIDITHDTVVYQTNTTFTIQATPGAQVALTLDGQIVGVQTAGTSPMVFNLPPLTPGQKLVVVATKQNYFRYRHELTVMTDQLLANFTANITSGCEGLSVDFTDLSSGHPTSWLWTFEGGTPSTSTEQNPTGIVYATEGSYPVTLTVMKGTESHTTTLDNFITTWAQPSAPIAHDTSACYAMPVPDLIAEGENIRWYSDSLLTNQVYSGNVFPTGITQIGNYHYYVTQSAGTCEGPATMVTLTISDYPIVTLTPFEPVCLNAAPFELTGGNPEGGVWQGTGVDTNYFNPALAGVGENTLSYTYTNEYGCSTTISQPMTVMDLPEVTLAPFTPLCDNVEPVELTGGLPEGGIYSGNGVENGFIYPSNIGAGETEIQYSYTETTTGCSNFAFQTISIKASPVISFGGDTTICHNHIITLDATNENSTYLWSTGETTPTIQVDSTGVGISGIKNISVTVNNSDGCTDSANIAIAFKDCTGIEELASSIGISIYPNPNQGNFTIELHSKQPTSVNMRILNLFSQQVFALDNLKVNQQALQNIYLDQLPNGIYILVIETNGQTFTQKFVIDQ